MRSQRYGRGIDSPLGQEYSLGLHVGTQGSDKQALTGVRLSAVYPSSPVRATSSFGYETPEGEGADAMQLLRTREGVKARPYSNVLVVIYCLYKQQSYWSLHMRPYVDGA
jgi:hypothetical protein